ncbi:hypothetical protein TREMEDRAFT_58162 [Tremella mesenterica DSM 1558]|uniref:uncharacterized protein n=1 Tax=Tremella mesenterica (strain ATCC 24925 / CBS 8224 / DSM 1558 / NBRC 9311 / NRRL Y-6157 / RJB 2259-6 / UBC 559-6) TaxID=578456 RepID=UPI0003F49268|nr:uncharacterized protein TREMEDRAFT_58162 [Tremella mesenterica DSM 1558]EIW72018.1 hypothetical protein TREMEDRAFT_58162 [Tremella mesenterica DSM 1558]
MSSWGVDVSLRQGTRQGTTANYAVVMCRVVNNKVVVDELRLTLPCYGKLGVISNPVRRRTTTKLGEGYRGIQSRVEKVRRSAAKLGHRGYGKYQGSLLPTTRTNLGEVQSYMHPERRVTRSTSRPGETVEETERRMLEELRQSLGPLPGAIDTPKGLTQGDEFYPPLPLEPPPQPTGLSEPPTGYDSGKKVLRGTGEEEGAGDGWGNS